MNRLQSALAGTKIAARSAEPFHLRDVINSLTLLIIAAWGQRVKREQSRIAPEPVKGGERRRHVRVRTCTHARKRTYTHMHAHTYMHARVDTKVSTHITHTHTQMHAHTYMHVRVKRQARMGAHTHARNARTHAHNHLKSAIVNSAGFIQSLQAGLSPPLRAIALLSNQQDIHQHQQTHTALHTQAYTRVHISPFQIQSPQHRQVRLSVSPIHT